jgi:hypothetical protein
MDKPNLPACSADRFPPTLPKINIFSKRKYSDNSQSVVYPIFVSLSQLYWEKNRTVILILVWVTRLSSGERAKHSSLLCPRMTCPKSILYKPSYIERDW